MFRLVCIVIIADINLIGFIGLIGRICFGFKIISIEKGSAVGCPRWGLNSLFSECRKYPKYYRLEKLGGKVKFLFLSCFSHSYTFKKEVVLDVTKYFVMRECESHLGRLLVTKHFVMRECENIASGYFSAVTTVFSQMMTIYCHNAQCAHFKGFPLF